MAENIGETPDSAFPGVPPSIPSSASIDNLTKETASLKVSISELTQTLKIQNAKDNIREERNEETNKSMLECLQEMRSQLHALLILQRESIVSTAEERRRKEPEIEDVTAAASAASGKGGGKGEKPEFKGGGKSSFLDVGMGIFFIAASIAALGVGLKLMNEVRLGAIVRSFIMIAALGTGLLLFSKLGSGEDMKKTALSLIILGAGIAALALGLKVFQMVSWGSIIKGAIALGYLAVVLPLLSMLADGNNLIKVSASLVILGAGLAAVALGLKLFEIVSWSSIFKGIVALGLLGTALAFMGLIAKGDNLIKAALSLIILSGAFIGLSFALNMFAAVPFGNIIKGTVALAMLGFTLGIISLLGGDRLIKAATGILIFGAALIVFTGALLLMNYVSIGSILKMFFAMILIMPIFTALMVVMAPAMVVFGFGLWLLAKAVKNFAEAMYIFAKAAIVFGIGFYIIASAIKSLNWEQLGMIGAVIVGFGLVLLGLGYALERMGGQKTFWKTAMAITLLSVSLMVLSLALRTLNGVGWESIGKAGAILLGFALVAKVIGENGGALFKAGLALLAVGIGIIPLAFGLKMFAGIEPQTVLTAALALTLVGGAAFLLGSAGAGTVLMGALSIAALGIALIPLALGLKMFAGIDLKMLGMLALGLVLVTAAAVGMGVLLPLIIPGAIAIVALGAALVVLGTALSIFDDFLTDFNETIKVFGDVAVNIIHAVGDVFGVFNTIITTTGQVIGDVIAQMVQLADPGMGMALLATAGGITAVAGALGLLMAAGGVGGVVSSAAGMVGGIMQGIGNFFTGSSGGVTGALQALGIIVEAAKYVNEITQLSTAIQTLSSALAKLAETPPIKAEVLQQLSEIIDKSERYAKTQQLMVGMRSTRMTISEPLTPESNAKTNFVESLSAEEISPYTSASTGMLLKMAESEKANIQSSGNQKYGDRHEKLLEKILQELEARGVAYNNIYTTNASSTTYAGGGGGVAQFIPIQTSGNRESTWKATQGSYRPAG
jgi:hypothetical protein